MNQADVLSRAAAKVREPDDEGFLVDGDGFLIALLPTQVAQPLAAWLEHTATQCAACEKAWATQREVDATATTRRGDLVFDGPPEPRPVEEQDALIEHHFGPALAVARALLREAPE